MEPSNYCILYVEIYVLCSLYYIGNTFKYHVYFSIVQYLCLLC